MLSFWSTRTPSISRSTEPSDASATIQSLQQLIAELSGEIQAYTALADKYFAFAGTLLVACLGVLAGARGEKFATAVAIAAPFALISILHYVAQLLTEKAARIGMKHAAEDRICALDPYGRFSTTHALARSVGERRPSVLMSIVVYATAALATVILCAGTINSSNVSSPGALIAVLIGSLAALAATATTSMIELLRAEDRAYRDASSEVG